MPAFVRTDKDEARWADAKKEAADEGKGNNYAYITTIYNRMKKGYDTSPLPQFAAIGSPFNHGEVPFMTVTRKPSIAADIDPERMPEPKTVEEMTLPLGPYHTAKDAVHGMGFSPHTERSIADAVETATTQSNNELRFKQHLMGKLLENFADDAATRRELYQRALTYYRGTEKSQSPALTFKATKKKKPLPKSRGLTRESRETRGGHKLQLRGRKDPVQEVQQTTRALPAGTIRVHYSSEHKGYVRAMKRADGTWKVLGSADGKKKESSSPKKKDHTKPRLTLHPAEHHRGHDAHHVAEDHHDSARDHVMTMKAKTADDRHQGKPSLPKERRTGSKKNPKGSAEGDKKITFDDKTTSALKTKVKEHNEKVDADSKKATLGALKAVYRRGAGAFSTSHRPGMTRAQWAYARVNHFLHLLKTGKPKDKKYITDNDLLPSSHPRSTKKSLSVEVSLVKAKRYQHINFKPPQSVAQAAEQGLKYRKKASPSNRGGLTPAEAGKHGIGSGVQRAVNLKNRDEMSPATVRMMSRFFSRHEKNKSIEAKNKGTPWNDKGYVAWLLWGGDPGKSWASKVIRQMDAADEKTSKRMTPAGPITTLYRAEREGPFADVKNKKYQINNYEHTKAAISYFSMPKNANEYSLSEQKAIWSRITAAAKKFKIELSPEAGPPSVETKKSNQSKEMEMNDIFKAIMDREVGDVPVMRPNDFKSEYTGMPEEALSVAKTEEIAPAATAAGAEEGNPESDSPMAPGMGSGDADGLAGATEGDDGMAKGEAHPNHLQSLNFSEQPSGTWNQGEDSRVTYSSGEDDFIAAAMEKSDNLCIAPEPSVRSAVTMGLQKSACGHQFAKALTVCPSCGTSSAGTTGQVQGLSISKSVQERLTAPEQLPSIRLAD